MLGPHGNLKETEMLISGLTAQSYLTSDHYTNYINVQERLPEDKTMMLKNIKQALNRPESDSRLFFIGNQ